MFKDALARVDGKVDFVSLHSDDPGLVEEYRDLFSPDFIILAGTNRPQGIAQRGLAPLTGRRADFIDLAETIARRMSLERPLTKKQLELLQYLRNGWTNKVIAQYMHVQPRTVKEWLKELYLLFFVSNRTELVARVVECSQTSLVSDTEGEAAETR
jgi:DNA-binding CsgD family transcriptional regulator